MNNRMKLLRVIAVQLAEDPKALDDIRARYSTSSDKSFRTPSPKAKATQKNRFRESGCQGTCGTIKVH
jgi:hypothetical protein